MKQNPACFPVRAMGRVLGLSSSGYYAWLKRPPSARALRNQALLSEIERIHEASRSTYGTYGRPRRHAERREEGHSVNHERVGHLIALSACEA